MASAHRWSSKRKLILKTESFTEFESSRLLIGGDACDDVCAVGLIVVAHLLVITAQKIPLDKPIVLSAQQPFDIRGNPWKALLLAHLWRRGFALNLDCRCRNAIIITLGKKRICFALFRFLTGHGRQYLWSVLPHNLLKLCCFFT